MLRDAKPKAAEKSWRRTLRETSEAKPVFGQTHANRDRGWSARLGKSGGHGNGGRPCASTLENGNGVGFAGRSTTALIFIIMDRPWPLRGDAEPVALFSYLRCTDRARRCRRSTRTMPRRSARPSGQFRVSRPCSVSGSAPGVMVPQRVYVDAMATKPALWTPRRGGASGEMTAGTFVALVVEAEWRKRAEGVVPAQPRARPEGQRHTEVRERHARTGVRRENRYFAA
jgi:hypothetical protein